MIANFKLLIMSFSSFDDSAHELIAFPMSMRCEMPCCTQAERKKHFWGNCLESIHRRQLIDILKQCRFADNVGMKLLRLCSKSNPPISLGNVLNVILHYSEDMRASLVIEFLPSFPFLKWRTNCFLFADMLLIFR